MRLFHTADLTWHQLCADVSVHMGWLRLVGSLKSYVSFAEYRLFYRALLQKRPPILRSLLIEATPYVLYRLLHMTFLPMSQCICDMCLRLSAYVIYRALHRTYAPTSQYISDMKSQSISLMTRPHSRVYHDLCADITYDKYFWYEFAHETWRVCVSRSAYLTWLMWLCHMTYVPMSQKCILDMNRHTSHGEGTAVRCNTLQHTATHCNMHCNTQEWIGARQVARLLTSQCISDMTRPHFFLSHVTHERDVLYTCLIHMYAGANFFRDWINNV